MKERRSRLARRSPGEGGRPPNILNGDLEAAAPWSLLCIYWLWRRKKAAQRTAELRQELEEHNRGHPEVAVAAEGTHL
jgi:hypothetical protein